MNANSCGHELYTMSTTSVGSVKAAVARILDQDQWIWCDVNSEGNDPAPHNNCTSGADENDFEHEVSMPSNETLFSDDNPPLGNPSICDAYDSTESPVESCESLKYAVRRAVRHFAGLFDALTGPQHVANTTRAKVLISALMHAIVNASSEEKRLNTTTHITPMNHRRRRQSVDKSTQKLASAFHALCLSPSSTMLQRNFLRQHIMVTLALLRRGIAPGALTKGWSCSSSRKSRDVADPSCQLRAIGFLAARTALMFAMSLRRAASQGSIA